jgi:hypothetical protein
MYSNCDTLTATVDDMFGQKRQVKLVLQPNGLYEESDEVRESPPPIDIITAIVEGRLGEEHRISLVRQPDGHYEESAD